MFQKQPKGITDGGGSDPPLSACLLCALREFRSRREEDVAGAVQRGLAGVFQNADDEADADDLSGKVIADAERSAGYRDQQQGTAGHAGSAAGADGGNDAEKERCRKIDGDAERIGSGQRQYGMVMDAPAILMVAPSGIEML